MGTDLDERMAVLGPHVFDGVPLVRSAAAAGVPLRTAQRWLAAYTAGGAAGLVRAPRSDRARRRRMPAELVSLVEGWALRRPPPRIAEVHRDAVRVAGERGWPSPSYTVVRRIVTGLDRGLRALGTGGPEEYRDNFELVLRRESAHPNDLWQADHTELDVMVLDETGKPARPWLTVVLDDHSRAVAGYTVFLGDPTAVQTALALRQAIWRKSDPAWPVCGVPAAVYCDHGPDFSSTHIAQVCADLKVQLVQSTPGMPRGRGKVERLFGTITTELLPTLPGHIPPGNQGRPVTAPALSLSELDARIGRYLVDTYHHRVHPQTGQPPVRRWLAGGWLPRMPDTVETLDLLLLTVATPRRVHRDGIRCHGLRYLALTLAAYVGEEVTVRYDPRDLAEIRVFHQGSFLCVAVSPELAAVSISLKRPADSPQPAPPGTEEGVDLSAQPGRRTDPPCSRRRSCGVGDHCPHPGPGAGGSPSADRDPAQDLPGRLTRKGHGTAVSSPAAPVDARPPRRLAPFLITKQHRRFAEFAAAVRRHRYVGACYGAPARPCPPAPTRPPTTSTAGFIESNCAEQRCRTPSWPAAP